MSRRWIVAVALIAALVAAACGGRGAERWDDAHDTAVEDRTGWEKLGERWVHGRARADRDVIDVGAHEGRFTRLMIVVEHSSIDLYDVDVTFGDGSHYSPPARLRFGRGSRSRVIDLPGGARVIRKVVFHYRNLRGGGRAQVELWAR